MPAPAVIPAPIVYFKVVAVKTLVVYLKGRNLGSAFSTPPRSVEFLGRPRRCLLTWLRGPSAPILRTLYRVSLLRSESFIFALTINCEKIKVLKTRNAKIA